MYDILQNKGYFKGTTNNDAIVSQTLSELALAGHSLLRTDIVTSRDDIESKKENIRYAVPNTFWFHSDGCFMPRPPRYVIIEVIKAEGGGGLSLIDCASLQTEHMEQDYLFGQGDHLLAFSVKGAEDGKTLYRYRQDYMFTKTPEDAQNLEAVHAAVRDAVTRDTILLGELAEKEYLVVDNWRMLHCRQPFLGERTIRRYWLT